MSTSLGTVMRQHLASVSRVLLILCLSFLVSACGYTLQGGGSILPPDVKRVYVPRVENSTTELALTELLTEALRDRFERFGVVTVVDDVGEADAVLKARILKVSRSTGSVTSNTDTALQVDTTVKVAAELRRVTGPVLWRDMNLSVTKSFGAERSVVVTSSPDFAASSIGAGDLTQLSQGGSREVARGQEEEAFSEIADETARIVYDNAVAPDF
jgi:outer membrane lipopolysaccharide assembly protein LptE/RlpB